MTAGRKDCRAGIQRCAPRTLRQALYCQVHHAQMTLRELAATMDVNPSTLNNWVDPDHDSRIPEDRLEHLLRLTDDRAVYVRYLAELQGQVVFEVPKGSPRASRTAAMLHEFADLLKALADRDDGTTAAEAERIAMEGHDVIAAIAAEIEDARRTVAATRGPGGPR